MFGVSHPDVAMTLNNLAVLYKTDGKYAEAEAMYERALSIFDRALRPGHPKVVTCLKNYASLLRKIGHRAEAKALETLAETHRQDAPPGNRRTKVRGDED